MKNLWNSLKTPFFVLAPMDGVTDFVFREVISETAKPDVFMTEFTNVDSLFSAGSESAMKRLKISEKQKPVVLQVWGNKPENFEKTAKLALKSGFAGIDINMGCPTKSVMLKKCGSALIDYPELAVKLVQATKKGSENKIAVSVKTRLGTKRDVSDKWIPLLLEQEIDALTIHFRLAKDESHGTADWTKVSKFIEMRDRVNPKTKIIGNGDVISYAQGVAYHDKYGVDGIMIGRGIFTNPWIFSHNTEEKTVLDSIRVFKRQIEIHKATWGEQHKFWELKKFIKMYLRNFEGSSKIRSELVEARTFSDFQSKIDEIEKSLL